MLSAGEEAELVAHIKGAVLRFEPFSAEEVRREAAALAGATRRASARVRTARLGTLGPGRAGRRESPTGSHRSQSTHLGLVCKVRCRTSKLAKPNLKYRRRYGHGRRLGR